MGFFYFVEQGHRRFALKNLVYPGVVRTDKPEDQVIGILCEGLNARDIELLDDFEGDVKKSGQRC